MEGLKKGGLLPLGGSNPGDISYKLSVAGPGCPIFCIPFLLSDLLS